MTEANPQARHPDQMSFFEHLEELRFRLFRSLIVWFAVFIACFIYVKEIFDVLAEPLSRLVKTGHTFAATQFQEPFMANLKAAFWTSVVFSSPIIFYQIWAFIGPGLTSKERKFAIPFLSFMALFFILGCLFGFYLIFPSALDYFIGWNDNDSLNAYTRTSYLSLLFAFVIGMGCSFETPLLIFFFSFLGIVTPKFLLDKFRYAVLIIFFIAALITPTPDFYMQTALAVPMLFLYLLGVGAAIFVEKIRKKQQVELDPEESVEATGSALRKFEDEP